MPIQQRAERMASRKNLDEPGMSSTNRYAICNSIDSASLVKSAVDSGLVMGSTQEEIDRSINSIKARELAQALLYEAAQKKKLAAHEKEQSSSVELSSDSENEDITQIVEELDNHSTCIPVGDKNTTSRAKRRHNKKQIPP